MSYYTGTVYSPPSRLMKTEQCATGQVYIRDATNDEVVGFCRGDFYRFCQHPGLTESVGKFSLVPSHVAKVLFT